MTSCEFYLSHFSLSSLSSTSILIPLLLVHGDLIVGQGMNPGPDIGVRNIISSVAFYFNVNMALLSCCGYGKLYIGACSGLPCSLYLTSTKLHSDVDPFEFPHVGKESTID